RTSGTIQFDLKLKLPPGSVGSENYAAKFAALQVFRWRPDHMNRQAGGAICMRTTRRSTRKQSSASSPFQIAVVRGWPGSKFKVMVDSDFKYRTLLPARLNFGSGFGDLRESAHYPSARQHRIARFPACSLFFTIVPSENERLAQHGASELRH